jgi:hypothetical protein
MEWPSGNSLRVQNLPVLHSCYWANIVDNELIRTIILSFSSKNILLNKEKLNNFPNIVNYKYHPNV